MQTISRVQPLDGLRDRGQPEATGKAGNMTPQLEADAEYRPAN
jgi:hypothetical protein